jgi:hypothetical protein
LQFVVGQVWLGLAWLGLAMIPHFFGGMFEFVDNPTIKNNKLRMQLTSQPGVKEKMLDGCC